MPTGPHAGCETNSSFHLRGLLGIRVPRKRCQNVEVTFCKEIETGVYIQ